jgi:hypothetical protein
MTTAMAAREIEQRDVVVSSVSPSHSAATTAHTAVTVIGYLWLVRLLQSRRHTYAKLGKCPVRSGDCRGVMFSTPQDWR